MPPVAHGAPAWECPLGKFRSHRNQPLLTPYGVPSHVPAKYSACVFYGVAPIQRIPMYRGAQNMQHGSTEIS